MAINCGSEKGNISRTNCDIVPQLLSKLITAPKAFTVSSTTGATSETWQNAIKDDKAARIYKWPDASDLALNPEEDVINRTALADIFVRSGKYSFQLKYAKNTNFQVANEMASHVFDETAWFTDGKYTWGWSNDQGVTVRGYDISLLNPGKYMLNDGSVNTFKPVDITLSDPDQMTDYAWPVDTSEFYSNLIPLSTVDVTVVGTPTATEVVVSVIKRVDNVPILGLETSVAPGDFIYLDGAGVAQSISNIADNGDGNYTFTGTGFVSGTADIKAAKDLSLDAYESSGAATVTI